MTKVKNKKFEDLMRPIHAIIIFQRDDNLHHYVTNIKELKF